jgi:hypothetical protein
VKSMPARKPFNPFGKAGGGGLLWKGRAGAHVTAVWTEFPALLAERVGFEPTVAPKRYTGFRGRCTVCAYSTAHREKEFAWNA